MATVTLKGGQSATATGLPTDITYTITEAAAVGFTTDKTGDTGTISTTESKAVFTNTREKGDLTLSKVLMSERAADKDQVFTFTVTLGDNTISGTYGDMIFADGVATVTLKGGQSATAMGLPTDITYEITEAAAVGFTTGQTGDTGTISTTKSEAVFTNTRETGDLTLSKKLVSDRTADADQVFTFTVELDDDSINGKYDGMTFISGKATVTLKGGESATAKGLPTDINYTITEKAATGFESKATTATNGTISTTPATVEFENTREVGDLEVTKTVDIISLAEPEKEFEFTITLSDKGINGVYGDMEFIDGEATFTLKNGETKKAEGLPTEIDYEVTEEAYPGYTTAATDESGEIVKGTTSAEFVNTYAAKGETELKGTKFISNREFKEGDSATMKIEALTEGAPMPAEDEITVTPESGYSIDYTFGTIEYELADLDSATKEFSYKVTEALYDMEGVEKDSTEYTVTVTVTDNREGKLDVTASENAGKLEFTNVYSSKGTVQFFGKKKLENRDLKAGEFTFVVKDADGNIVREATNDEYGNITFEPIEYTHADMTDNDGVNTGSAEFIYTISEVKPDDYDATVIYDDTVVTVTVTLKDLWNGEIEVTASDEALAIEFTNIVMKAWKVDAEDGHALEGAEIQVIDKETEETVFTFTSGKEPTELENLEAGREYILRETIAPHGYKLAGDVIFSVGKGEAGVQIISTEDMFTDEETGYRVLLVKDEMITVSAAVKKVWDDDGNRDGIRPISLRVNLLANGVKIRSVSLNSDNGWLAQIGGLPMVDAEQKDIAYTWEEEMTNGVYTLSGSVTEGTLTTLTNSYGPEKTTVSVRKVWVDDDNSGATRPAEIRVQLYANGKAEGEEIVLSADNGWSYTWTGLNRYANESGKTSEAKAIRYTVEEIGTPEGYTSVISGSEDTGYVITNTLESGKLIIEKTFEFVPVEPDEPDDSPIDIPVIKTWNDNANKDGNRPASVTVRLLADGTEVASALLTEADGWRTTFTGLPRYNGEEKIVYTITEDPVDWYTAEIHGFNIRNNYQPETTSVSVRKVWRDNNNAAKLRPTSIYMTLSNGTAVLLNEANGWSATVDNLPTRINGQPAEYTWTEQTVLGYRLISTEQEGSTTVFTNEVITRPPEGTTTDRVRIPNGDWTTFEEYETALGIDSTINHVGDCFD